MVEGIHAEGRDISIPSSFKPFQGLIGDVRIYGKAVSAERALELYNEQAERRTSIDFRIRE